MIGRFRGPGPATAIGRSDDRRSISPSSAKARTSRRACTGRGGSSSSSPAVRSRPFCSSLQPRSFSSERRSAAGSNSPGPRQGPLSLSSTHPRPMNAAIGANPAAPTWPIDGRNGRIDGRSDGGADNGAGSESADDRAGSPTPTASAPAPTGSAPPSAPPNLFNLWRKRPCACGRGKSESSCRGDLRRQQGNSSDCA